MTYPGKCRNPPVFPEVTAPGEPECDERMKLIVTVAPVAGNPEPVDGRYAPLEVAPGIIRIDLGFQQTAGVIASYLLVGDTELALIETGPTTTRKSLEQGIREAGFDIADVTNLIPTHIHLDHAGAAGGLMRDHPRMRMHLHPVGAPYLIDPERLVSSAGRIYGDRMDALWGEVVGAPGERVETVEDGDTLNVAGRTLRAVYTPGHAGNHIAWFDEASRTLFTGDAAAARIAPSTFVLPTVSPPEIDFDLWTETIARMRAVAPERLALTHFGVYEDVNRHLDAVLPNSERALGIVREALRSGLSDEETTIRLLEAERSALDDDQIATGVLGRMELAMPAWLATLGLRRVLKKRGEIG
jgi:glyoxylase-like metal-dependent hydrolase (beta-lactamase superfamily II)